MLAEHMSRQVGRDRSELLLRADVEQGTEAFEEWLVDKGSAIFRWELEHVRDFATIDFWVWMDDCLDAFHKWCV